MAKLSIYFVDGEGIEEIAERTGVTLRYPVPENPDRFQPDCECEISGEYHRITDFLYQFEYCHERGVFSYPLFTEVMYGG